MLIRRCREKGAMMITGKHTTKPTSGHGVWWWWWLCRSPSAPLGRPRGEA